MTPLDRVIERLRDGAMAVGDTFVGISAADCRLLLEYVDPPDQPDREPLAQCDRCPAPILFAVDERGTRQVLDQRAPVFRLLGNGRARRVPLHVAKASHFATCSGLRK